MFQSEINQIDIDHIYLDLIASNNDAGSNTPSSFLTFSEIRDQAILPNCSEYYLTIVRFYLETPNLPLLLMPIQTGQSDINKSSLSVTLTYKNYQFQQFLQYIPANVSDTLPSPPLIKVDYNSTYYDIYSYQNFIEMLNTAFLACYNGLNALVITGGDTLPSSYFPYMEFDPSAEKAILNADILGYNKTLANPISIYMNSTLFQLFSSFDASFYGNTNIVNGMNYKFNIYALPNSGNVYGILSTMLSRVCYIRGCWKSSQFYRFYLKFNTNCRYFSINTSYI